MGLIFGSDFLFCKNISFWFPDRDRKKCLVVKLKLVRHISYIYAKLTISYFVLKEKGFP